jgi:hypothetical protein
MKKFLEYLKQFFSFGPYEEEDDSEYLEFEDFIKNIRIGD